MSLITHKALILPYPIEGVGYGIINIEAFWNSLKMKILLKTRYCLYIYAKLFNDEISSYGYNSLHDLTAAGPGEIVRVALKFQNLFWR